MTYQSYSVKGVHLIWIYLTPSLTDPFSLFCMKTFLIIFFFIFHWITLGHTGSASIFIHKSWPMQPFCHVNVILKSFSWSWYVLDIKVAYLPVELIGYLVLRITKLRKYLSQKQLCTIGNANFAKNSHFWTRKPSRCIFSFKSGLCPRYKYGCLMKTRCSFPVASSYEFLPDYVWSLDKRRVN